MRIAGGLREAVVETTAATAGHVGHHAVEYLSSPFILVEAVVQEGPQEAPALGDSEAICAIHPFDGRCGVIFDVGEKITNRGRPEPGDRRVLRGENNLIDFVRLKPALHLCKSAVGREFPLIAGNRLPWAVDPIANEKL